VEVVCLSRIIEGTSRILEGVLEEERIESPPKGA